MSKLEKLKLPSRVIAQHGLDAALDDAQRPARGIALGVFGIEWGEAVVPLAECTDSVQQAMLIFVMQPAS